MPTTLSWWMCRKSTLGTLRPTRTGPWWTAGCIYPRQGVGWQLIDTTAWFTFVAWHDFDQWEREAAGWNYQACHFTVLNHGIKVVTNIVATMALSALVTVTIWSSTRFYQAFIDAGKDAGFTQNTRLQRLPARRLWHMHMTVDKVLEPQPLTLIYVVHWSVQTWYLKKRHR